MKPEDRSRVDWLRNIERAAGKIVAATADTDSATFAVEDRVRDYVLWQLMVMGEASGFLTRLHPEFAAKTALPLGAMRMFRNRLVHGYHNLDANIIWLAATREVPGVLTGVRVLLAEEPA